MYWTNKMSQKFPILWNSAARFQGRRTGHLGSIVECRLSERKSGGQIVYSVSRFCNSFPDPVNLDESWRRGMLAGCNGEYNLHATRQMRSAEFGMRNGKAESKKSKSALIGSRTKGFYSVFRIPHSALIKRHLRPVPRVEWGRALASSRCAGAMIDVSDGLSSDLSHICEQSGVGAVIDAGKIPLSPQLRRVASRLGAAPLQYALSGGEDYELLFTVPRGKSAKLRALGVPATEIGEITRQRTVQIMDASGKKTVLAPTGFDHFARASRRKAF